MPLQEGKPRGDGKDTRITRVPLGFMLPFGVVFCSWGHQTVGETCRILANM